MAWNEDKRREPSTSKANADENVRRARQPTGSRDSATARIAAAMSGNTDTRTARARLRLRDFRRDDRLEHLEEIVNSGEYKPSPTERIELGAYQSGRDAAEDAADLLGGDAA